MKSIGYFILITLFLQFAASAPSAGLPAPLATEVSSGKTVTLSPIDRSLLTEYRILGRKDIPLVIAAEPTGTGTVAGAIKSAGGQILSEQDAIGYLYVQIPIVSLKVIVGIAGIDAMQVACYPTRGEAAEELDNGPVKQEGIPPSPFLAAENPYTGESATQASTFKALHSTFDGRGVVIAFTEYADPAAPSMNGALDLRGTPLAKFRMYSWGAPDIVGEPEGIADRGNYFYWQRTVVVVPGVNKQVNFNGHNYRLPDGVEAKEWRLCLRREPESWWLSDKTPYIVLWAVDQRRIWIMDENENDFTRAHTAEINEPWFFVHVRDFAPKKKYQSLDWAFNVDVDRRLLGFGQTIVRHGAMVASVMAGKSFLGSATGGVAPAAQLAIFSSGRVYETPELDQMDNFLSAFQYPATDIIQSSLVIGASGRLRGNGAYTQLAARLIRATGKPFVDAVGNSGTDLKTIYGFAAADEAFTVGGFTPRETLLVNFGYEPLEDMPVGYSSYGPAADGGLKPDFLALTGTLSESEYGSAYWASPFGFYGPSRGTSAASPNAAGSLALLISAAKQSGVQYDVARLRAAIVTTAKFLPEVEARAQGHGLIQTSEAWAALKRANHWQPSRFVTRASVVSAEGITESKEGRGLFEMSGWTPGLNGQREIIVTRIAGPIDPLPYRLKWKGSTQVFSSSSSEVVLPLNQPVRIPIDIKAGDVGSYSAILDFIDPSVELVAHSIMTTIFVAAPLTPANDYKMTFERSSARERVLLYVNVPVGLSGLKVHLKRENDKGAAFTALDPTGRKLLHPIYGSAPEPVPSFASVKGEQVQLFDHPTPGVWQVTVTLDGVGIKTEGKDGLYKTKFAIQFVGYRVDSIPTDMTYAAKKQTVTFVNKTGAELKGHINGLGLGSVRNLALILKPGLTAALFEVGVAEGTKRLEISLEHDDPNSWVGLYVYKAPDGPNKEFGDPKAVNDATPLIYEDWSHATEKHWVLESPNAGRYIIAVDPLHVPISGLKLHYRDVVIHPAFGEMSCTGSGDLIPPLGTQSASLSWTVRALPLAERQLIAECALIAPEAGNSTDAGTKGAPEETTLTIVPVPISTQTILVQPQ